MSETTSTNTKTFKLSAAEAALIEALRAAQSAQEPEQASGNAAPTPTPTPQPTPAAKVGARDVPRSTVNPNEDDYPERTDAELSQGVRRRGRADLRRLH